MASSHIAHIEQTDFDGMPAWRIEASSGARAIVAERGATLISWQPRAGVEIIDGYHSAQELSGTVSSRSRIQAPWCGRIKDGRYAFDGSSYELALNEDGEALHGLVADKDFSLINANNTLTLGYEFSGEEGYPFSFAIEVTFSLESGADGEEHLSVTITARNTSETDIPLAVGWHPYIKLPGNKTISNVSLEIPARTKILVDSALIPRAGEAAYAGVKAPVIVDYMGSTKFDTSFRGLIPDDDGVVVTTIRDLAGQGRVSLTQEPADAPVVHVFTADNLPRDSRASIALEPLSHLPDAFNRADSKASVRLAPGGIRQLTATLTYGV
ncbi:aldose 1-epimerase [Arcanobacterium pluranimalium]|uniref:aldose 1-epimerase n=1 Tax=Arcanobacterium pluranimalium TaxID=108028 RepID=UPI0019568ACC|nr:aldose 1-epimerase [Arcanobacterium pluranimalium]MBM7825261.1 aldose 1-epimerase [Arcanobacterium pluranimalium]